MCRCLSFLCCCCCCCCRNGKTKLAYTMNDTLLEVCEEMHLSDQEIARLFKAFRKMDKGHKGSVSKDELFDYLGLDRGWFVDTIFEAMDVDKDGQWSFTEWLTALARINLYTHEQLMDFLFRTFDMTDSGYIDGEALSLLMQTIHGPQSLYPLPMERAVDLYDEKGDGKLDFVEFATAEAKFPILMWPVFEMQVKLQASVLGISFWNKKFSLIHPDMEIHHYKDVREKFEDWSAGVLECMQSCLNVCFPCIESWSRKTAVSEENLRKHEMEKAKMKQNATETLFDGFNAVGAVEESKEDSEDEIEELTDDEAFDVNAYLPKNGIVVVIHCLLALLTSFCVAPPSSYN